MKCKIEHCQHQRVDESEFCQRHSNEKQRVRQYRLNSKRLQDRIDELTQVEAMASLKAEVALAQIQLEERYNALGVDPSASEVAAVHKDVNDSLRTIEKLVASMHKNDLAINAVFSRFAAFQLIADIVDAVSNRLEPFADHPEYPALIDNIDNDLEKIVNNATN